MGKRPLTPAEIAQRRAAGKLGGRPSSPVSRQAVAKAARERSAVARARGRVRSVQEEVAETLIRGMRGMLPGSTAGTMILAAEKLAAKGGLHDLQEVKHTGDGAPVAIFRIGVDPKEYPAPIEGPADAAARSEDGSALEN